MSAIQAFSPAAKKKLEDFNRRRSVLTNCEQVSVRITRVAASLAAMVMERPGQELGAFGLSGRVAAPGIGHS